MASAVFPACDGMIARISGDHDRLLARSRGFFVNVELHDPRMPDAILVHGRFDLESYTEDLFDELAIETPVSLSRALPIRRAEFLAGRAIARAALHMLGQPAPQIPIGPDRAPLWPPGSAGSISHARGHCACFAIADGTCQAGVDVEATASGHALEALLSTTVDDDERALIARQSALSPDCLVTLLFSAKETLFKALYPTARHFFGFDCAQLRAVPRDGRLRLHLTRTLCQELPKGERFDVSFEITAGHVLTWLAVRRYDASI
ncbi:4'-phosphopantetheinyl transferase superfamily protein [Mesorhizobium sp. M1A.F.Ca.ET.072.01.1.1]|nr:4'-phosphopantetheinyl transferase superfamily protein [Mesorhizobium sp. M1A.F.Ca.ET.072.01.1.1]TIV03402.1 MAG: 4'-phosphopantetheinyl transferase superfamily protein [Mesorhizobium sp.]